MQPLSESRRRLVTGVAVVWLAATLGLLAAPAPADTVLVMVAEPELRSWVEDLRARDPALAERVQVEAIVAGTAVPAGAAWLGLEQQAPAQGQRTPLARSPYVVVAWETSLDRLGLRGEGPVDWAAVQRGLAESDARFVLPTTATPLGADALVLLALARSGNEATTLPAGAAGDPALRTWLQPFFKSQVRQPRSDERALVDDWALHRVTLGNAGLLPEHAALALAANPAVVAQAPLYLRYPAVNLTRSYVLVAPPGGGAALERLRAALLAEEVQRLLPARGFRPATPLPAAPTEGPFASLRDRGARWEATWKEATRNQEAERLVREWRP